MPIDVFVSYATADRAAVELLATSLRERDLAVFVDRWYLTPGRPWPDALEAALSDCKAVIIVLGPAGLGAWQRRESHLALDRQAQNDDFPVIPVLLPGADPALGFLSLNTWIDLRAGSDPGQMDVLAAAVRGERPESVPLGDGGAPTLVSPYRGLRPFREEDARFFLGREAFTARLVRAVRDHPVVAVIGPSGSGKSSVVKAGLVPNLRTMNRGDVWDVVEMVPGSGSPFRAVAAALIPLLEPDMTQVDLVIEVGKLAKHFTEDPQAIADVVRRSLDLQPGTDRLLLFIDQWEELYTSGLDDQSCQRFIDALLDATKGSPLSVVLTIRGDFYGRALGYRPLADTLQDAVVNISTMTRAELDDAIVKPAEQVGLAFEPGLVDRILDDVGSEPGNLPLLEFVLDELWLACGGRALSHEAYGRMGGLQGAIATKADETLEQLGSERLEDVHRIFLHLVQPGTDSGDTRRRATFAEIGADALPLVNQLTDSRLLVTGRDQATNEETVEVAHEALLRNWETLQTWVEADREFLAWRRRLEALLEAWVHSDHDVGALLRGAQLSEAERWVEERADDLSIVDREFISGSIAHHQMERNLELERARRSSRQAWRLVAALGAIVVLAVVASVVAQRLRQQAEHQARIAFTSQLAEGARADVDEFPQRSALLAVEAATALDPPRPIANEALRAVVAGGHGTPLSGHSDAVTDVAFGPDGAWLASTSDDGTVRLWDRADPTAEPTVLEGGERELKHLGVSPDGLWLAASDLDRSVRLWDLSDPDAGPTVLSGHRLFVNDLAFSVDSRWLVTGSEGGQALLWPLAPSAPPSEATTLFDGNAVHTVTFSRGGQWLAVAGSGPILRVWRLDGAGSLDTDAGPTLELDGHSGIVLDVNFSQDERWLASGSRDGTARVWDLSVADPAGSSRELSHGDGWVNAVAFSLDGGNHLATGSETGTVRLWDVDSMADPGSAEPLQPSAVLRGHQDSVEDVLFVPDAGLLASASSDGTTRLWNADGSSPAPRVLRGHEGRLGAMAVSNDGRWLATGGSDTIARLWHLTGAQADANPIALPRPSAIEMIAVSDDGLKLATADDQGWSRVWTFEGAAAGLGPALYAEREASAGAEIASTALSSDGRLLARATSDLTTELWELQTGKQLEALESMTDSGQVTATAFSADDRLFAVASADGYARVWDTGTFEEVATLPHSERDVMALAFSPDRRWLATGSRDSTAYARLWDLTGDDPTSGGAILDGHFGTVTVLAFSAAAGWLASGDDDGQVRVWAYEDADPAADPTVLEHTDAVTDLAFSPDGRFVATSSRDGVVMLWDLRSSDPRNGGVSLRGHGDEVTAVAFSYDGRWLATASTDTIVRLWRFDSSDPTELSDPVRLRHDDQVTALAFVRGSTWLATASKDGSVRLWLVATADLVDLACAGAGRNLTSEEWESFLPEEDYRRTCSQWP